MKKIILFWLSSIFFFVSCKESIKSTVENQDSNSPQSLRIDTMQGVSLLDKPLTRPQINEQRDSVQIKHYDEALENYNRDSTEIDNIIWLGRRIAYLGDYKKAISIYSKGIDIHGNEPRLYRHRGHRYISLRKFDEAISDFEKAVKLIEGENDIIEEDGIPNSINKPVSSLHTNIYYHLGLAYYLKNELNKAEAAFTTCLEKSKNDDMRVAAIHWLYMILRKQDKIDVAKNLLNDIEPEMNIIENDGYHQLLLFYKGLKSEDELTNANGIGSSEAIKYGVANWHLYNGNVEKAKEKMTRLVNEGNWAGFGYIAAESDLQRLQEQ